mgnify:CR=1 FL=1|tara:strand:+ start:163 stop:363 length:201 start_codon:yes stop_codon:yes gene_type:complete
MKKKILIFLASVPFVFLPVLDILDLGGDRIYDQKLTAKFLAIGYYIILFIGYVLYKKYVKKDKELE